MNKFLSFVGRNMAIFLASLWFGLAIAEIFAQRYYIAFLQFNLAMVWAFVYTNEQSEKRLLEKLINRKTEARP